VTDEHFSGTRQVVDWYDAKEHLANAGAQLYGEGSVEAHRWVQRMETAPDPGRAAYVAAALRKEAGHFQTNARRMQYLEPRRRVPDREWHGRKWHPPVSHALHGTGDALEPRRGRALLPVRAAILSKRFDEVWRSVYNLPPN
jgi:hypothetical protein